MQIPSHGLFDRQTIHVQDCTTKRESPAAPDHVQFKSGMQEAEHTGRFRGLHCQVFLHYRCLRLKARGISVLLIPEKSDSSWHPLGILLAKDKRNLSGLILN